MLANFNIKIKNHFKMKKIIYLSAIVFPIAFAACSQEELVLEQGNNNSQVEVKPGIEGARIAAKGMNIILNQGSDSRLAGTGWEKGDRLGVAWVTAHEDLNDMLTANEIKSLSFSKRDILPTRPSNIGDYAEITSVKSSKYVTVRYGKSTSTKQFTYEGDDADVKSLLKKGNYIKISGWTCENFKNSEDSYYYVISPIAGISRPQGSINWNDFATVTDEKLYANLMYEYTGSSFGYYGDIYEGAYFAYWPFERLNSIKTKNFNLNMSQNINNAEKFYLENAVSVSAIDSVYAINENYEPVIKENISKSFSLVRVANAIFVNTQFTGSENVSNLKISSVSVAVRDEKLFSNKADFYPHKLPVAVYNTEGKYDKEETLKNMTKAELIGVGKAFNITEYSDKLEATPSVDMPIASENSVCMLTYPTSIASVVANDVEITVNVKEDGEQGNVGYFTIKYSGENPSANDKANNDAISKLAALLNGGYTLSGKTYSLQEFNSVYFNIPIKLDMKNYTSTKDWEVKSAEKWNQTIDAIDALNLKTANIKVTDNITFKGISPKFPKTTKITVNDKEFTLEDVNAQINSEVSGINYTVKKDATLTIEDNATVNGTIQVDGTLNVLGEAKGKITVTKSAYNEGIVNLGAEGIISNIENNSKINVTEGTKNKILSYSDSGEDCKVYANVTNGTNAANIINNVHATDITFSNANISTTLNTLINYTTEGNTTFTGNLGTSCQNLIVKNGTLTIGDNSVITVTRTTINSGAKLVVATGNDKVEMTNVINNGTVELQKNSKGQQTTWNAPKVTGTGSVILNGNIHNKN